MDYIFHQKSSRGIPLFSPDQSKFLRTGDFLMPAAIYSFASLQRIFHLNRSATMQTDGWTMLFKPVFSISSQVLWFGRRSAFCNVSFVKTAYFWSPRRCWMSHVNQTDRNGFASARSFQNRVYFSDPTCHTLTAVIRVRKPNYARFHRFFCLPVLRLCVKSVQQLK